MQNAPAIVVPTDLTADAEAAYPFALRWAEALGRSIRLLLVESSLAGGVLHRHPDLVGENPLREGLAQLVAELTAKGGSVTSQIRSGFPAREILKDLDEDAQMVVVALHGQVGRPHRMLGSVAAKVIRASPVPTLVVRSPMEDRPIERITMSVDFSETETGALDEAIAVARLFGAGLEFVHVLGSVAVPLLRSGVDASAFGEPLSEAELVSIAEADLMRFVERATVGGVLATTRVIHHPEPIAPLAAVIASSNPDLVIMAAHGRRGFSRLVLGSVTEDLVRISTRPVLVLKPARTYHESTSG